MNRNTWSVLLAGGEGTRLRGLSHDASGRHCPKQFCAFGPGPSLLRRSVERAAALVPKSRIVAVVTEPQRRWWASELDDLHEANIVVQPRNRGTAPAVLWSLLRILNEDSEARVMVFPSDHFVHQEPILRQSLQEALASAEGNVVLLGAMPRRADTDLGWIQPLPADDSTLLRVDSFVEKPDWRSASELKRQGGLLNMLILAASGEALLDLFRRTTPELLNTLGGDRVKPSLPSTEAICKAYESISTVDFSHDVLEKVAGDAVLWVKVVPQCGWFDIGTPERLATLPVFVGDRLRGDSIDSESQRFGSDYWLG